MYAQMPKKRITPEEYLAIERQAEYKSEYFDGEMFAMAGASRQHNIITANLIRLLGNQLFAKECTVYTSDMRVKIESVKKYTYPDVVVACQPEQFEDAEQDTLLTPVVIIEVLSDSTEAYDRGKKFEYYQRLPSLQVYLLVSQTPYRVEQYIRQGKTAWTYTEFHQEDDVVSLEIIACELALKDLYAKLC